MWIYQQRLWFNVNLPAKIVIQWEFTSKNGDSMWIYQQKWWFNRNLPAKIVIYIRNLPAKMVI